jgi:hypothetical protein
MAESSNMSLFTTGNLPLRVQAIAVFQIDGVERTLCALGLYVAPSARAAACARRFVADMAKFFESEAFQWLYAARLRG